MKINNVVKRDGSIVPFDREKIAIAISKAMREVYDGTISDEEITKRSEEYSKEVHSKLEALNTDQPTVEQIQDTVEQVMMEKDSKVAKAYIIYRNKRAELRAYKESLGIEDDLKLPLNSLIVLAARYLLRDENRRIIETPKQLFERVSKAIASADYNYGADDKKVEEIAKSFYDAMTSFDFMPNSPTLMNAGTSLGQLSACFVLPVGDSIEEIFDAVKWTAIIHKSGGGTGFSFSRLRPAGDVVKQTGASHQVLYHL